MRCHHAGESPSREYSIWSKTKSSENAFCPQMPTKLLVYYRPCLASVTSQNNKTAQTNDSKNTRSADSALLHGLVLFFQRKLTQWEGAHVGQNWPEIGAQSLVPQQTSRNEQKRPKHGSAAFELINVDAFINVNAFINVDAFINVEAFINVNELIKGNAFLSRIHAGCRVKVYWEAGWHGRG